MQKLKSQLILCHVCRQADAEWLDELCQDCWEDHCAQEYWNWVARYALPPTKEEQDNAIHKS